MIKLSFNKETKRKTLRDMKKNDLPFQTRVGDSICLYDMAENVDKDSNNGLDIANNSYLCMKICRGGYSESYVYSTFEALLKDGMHEEEIVIDVEVIGAE